MHASEAPSAPPAEPPALRQGEDAWSVLEAPGAAQSIGQELQQAVETVGADPRWPDRERLLDECREMDSILAAVLLIVGFAYSAFGYTLFKLVVVLNLAGLGVWGGWWVGKQFDARLPGMMIGGVLAAAVAWPALRYSVALCSGLVGFIIGVAAWRSCGLLDAYAPAGGLIGAVFLFMLSFILLKLSIIAFTSVQGVVMLLGGLLGLLMKYPQVNDPVTQYTAEHRVILPITILVLTIIGMLFQQSWNRAPAEAPAK